MKHSTYLRRVANGALLLASLVVVSAAAIAQGGGARPPLESIVDANGALAVPAGTSGSFDASGWVMTTGDDGSPRFVRKSSPTLHRVAGDEHWDDRFGPPGAGGPVYAVAAWGDEVFIGGRFRVAGTTIANNIVSFNMRTSEWRILGDDEINGVGGPVYALATFNGLLYVGGTFEAAGGVRASGIARWDVARRRWSSLGGGVAYVRAIGAGDAVWPGHVYAIAVDSQSVFVGGEFLMADADTVGNLARWDIASQSWSAACKSDANRTNGAINALALDGGSLYVGGTFTSVADIDASRIARWDLSDNSWHRLGSGINGPVLAIAAYDGRIVAGGSFATAGGAPAQNIAQWNGATWQQVGPGLDSAVHALHSSGGSLYVGGGFHAPGTGSVPLNGVARWNGGGFVTVGLGVADDTLPLVRSLVFSGDRLYVGGNFTSAGIAAAFSVAQFDSVWTALGGLRPLVLHGADAEVHALAIDGDNVYVGGDFATAGGVEARRVARWSRSTGQWFSLGGGIDGNGALVRAMALAGNGDLYVGGIFPGAGGVASSGIVRWDGTSWQSVGGGVGGDVPFVFALELDGQTLYAGGAFTTAGGITSPKVARYDITSSTWSALGDGITGDSIYSYVAAIAAEAGRVVVGGEFLYNRTERVNRLLEWKNDAWAPVGPAGRYGVNGSVSAIALDGAATIVGGDFTIAGGQAQRYLARFDGSALVRDTILPDGPVRALHRRGESIVVAGEFTRVGAAAIDRIGILRPSSGTWSALKEGTNGSIYAIALVDDEIYAGGSFSSAGNARTANVAQWTAESWSSMGSDPSFGINDSVLALAVRDGDVYVGGRFRTAGGVRSNGIARWDGTRWLTVGDGMRGPDVAVRALALAPNGDLYAGGTFVVAGDDSVNNIARWDGSRWSALGSGVTGTPQRRPVVHSIAVGDGVVYVGGEFTRAGGADASSVAAWNTASSTWATLGGGIRGGLPSPAVHALAIYGSDLVAAGRFDSAGASPSPGVARWNGTSWSAMGTVKLDGYSLVTDGTRLVLATGGIERVTIPPATSFLRSSHYLLQWGGTDWTTLDSGSGVIYAMAFDTKGGIYAGGWFTTLESESVNGVAYWDGTKWNPLGSGLVGVDHTREFTIGSAFALATIDDDLYVGGNFIVAGRKPSYYFAHWSPAISSAPRPEPPAVAVSADMLHVMPNPIDRGAVLRLDVGATLATVRLFDMLGVERLRVAAEAASGIVALPIDQTIAAGAYIVRVESKSSVKTGRVMVR